jgi:hypothetical protein
VTETQQRFLRAIAERVAAERVAEVRLFPSVRQGPLESGVAVVAVEELAAGPMEREVPLPVTPADLHAIGPVPARRVEGGGPHRLSVLTARYVLTLKGPERGKWEFQLVHDADAPLDAVEQAVRGVARRVGEEGEPDLLSAATFQRALAEPWWSATA